MVIVLPLGLLATAATFDLIGVSTRNRQLLHASYYMLGAGLLTATGAAVPGARDYFSIPPNTRAKRIASYTALGTSWSPVCLGQAGPLAGAVRRGRVVLQ